MRLFFVCLRLLNFFQLFAINVDESIFDFISLILGWFSGEKDMSREPVGVERLQQCSGTQSHFIKERELKLYTPPAKNMMR